MNRSRGVTLIELMMACFLFGLFSTMVARAVVLAYDSHGKQSDKIANYRRACIAMNLLCKELKECQCIVNPDYVTWGFNNEYEPGNNHFNSLQFFYANRVEGWYLSE